ncbi:NUDIX domain-containing protein [Halobium salinum]|uniref:NUDIX domain-containing protein n=1 Tax=Halobium salinum TaxID=1364940 RepID=A0ABD5P8I9_9EURY|nr:NUDIX domain-containing protein [Halobium salinum]
MSLESESRARVDGLVESLRADYGDAPVYDEEMTVSPGRFRDMARVVADGVLDGGAAYVRDDEGRLLLQRATGSGTWSVPGGGLEGGETLVESAVREVREETGVDCEVTGLRFCRRVRLVADGEGSATDDALYRLGAFFEGRYVGGTVGTDDPEVADVRWVESLPDDVDPAVARYADLD